MTTKSRPALVPTLQRETRLWLSTECRGSAHVLRSPVVNGVNVAASDATLYCGLDTYTDFCGAAVAPVGDVDGDGIGDVVVGDPETWNAAGALLYRGPISGTRDAPEAATTWTRGEGYAFGADIVGGDLDGDGLADVVITDTGHSTGLAAALVYRAPLAETIPEEDADARLFADGTYPPFSNDLVSIRGDVDGDGYNDMVFGRPELDTYGEFSGGAYLYRGPFSGDRQPADADATLLGVQASEAIGQSTDICRDQDGDGRDEVVVGSNTGGDYARAVYVMLGPVTGVRLLPEEADAAIVGRIQTEGFGAHLECMDDLDGDGFGDLAVTSWSSDSGGVDSGAAFLFFGPFLGVRDAGTADLEIRGDAGDNFGTVTGSGDLDGDGVTDLLVGALRYGAAGAVYTIPGARLVELAGR